MSEYRAAEKAEFDPQYLHDHLLAAAPRRLGYRSDGSSQDIDGLRRALSAKLTELLGVPGERTELEPLWGQTELRPLPRGEEIGSPDSAEPAYDEIALRRVEFNTEPRARAIGWYVEPVSRADASIDARPTVICLQGHTSGAHISLGVERFDQDKSDIISGKDYALQAARRGYNALALEQRNFGERMDSRDPSRRPHYDYEHPFTDERCRHQAMVSLLLGRTVIGERVLDVRGAVDLLANLPGVSADRIYCMGNSGGGTTAFYAACVEPRIAGVMPSCSFAPYASTIGSIDHCSDNYLPGALNWFDMPDLALLIAPRPMVVVAGAEDNIFPLPTIRDAYTQAERIYADLGRPENLRLHVGAGAHTFFPEAWNIFDEIIKAR